MAITIFGEPHTIIRTLGERERTRVFLAESAEGQKVVIKVHLDPDLFFDELARYYACDQSPFLSKVLQNYPPYVISGNEFAFQKEFAEHLGLGNEVSDEERKAEQLIDTELASVGALVLEYFEGEPLSLFIGETDPKEHAYYLSTVCDALAELHQHDEYHGKLFPENILVNRESREIRFTGLDYCPGRTFWEAGRFSPEHHPCSPVSVGPPSDVFMFAFHFLNGNDPQQKNRKIIEYCLDRDPVRRPPITLVKRAIRGGKLSRARNRSALVWSPSFRMLATAALVLFSIAGITVNRSNPFLESRQMLMENARLNPEQAIEGLTRMRGIYVDRQEDLSGAIAEAKQHQSHTVSQLEPEDLREPLAVFAFERRPIIVAENQSYEIGDWVRIQGQTGFISEIRSRYYSVRFGDEEVRYPFARPDMTVNYSVDKAGVMIWPHPNNLGPIIQALKPLPKLMGEEASVMTRLSDSADLFLQTSQPIDVSPGQIYGFYMANNFSTFLDRLETQVEFSRNKDVLEVAPSHHSLPAYLIYSYINTQDIKIGDLCKMLSRDLGYEFIAPKQEQAKLLKPRKLVDKDWREILSAMDLKWTILLEDDQTRIRIESMD